MIFEEILNLFLASSGMIWGLGVAVWVIWKAKSKVYDFLITTGTALPILGLLGGLGMSAIMMNWEVVKSNGSYLYQSFMTNEVEDYIIECDFGIMGEKVIPIPAIVSEVPPPPPPPPPPPEWKKKGLFITAEEMPRFPGCEGNGSTAEKKRCADQELLKFIYKNISYPPVARESAIEGTCVVRFTITKKGYLENIKLLRDIGGACGKEALRVVKLMNKQGIRWVPGKQRGQAVDVQFNLPIKFRLE